MKRELKPYPMPVSEQEAESSGQPTEHKRPYFPGSKRSKPAWLKWLIPAVAVLVVILIGGSILHSHQKANPKHNSDSSHTVQPSNDLSGQNTSAQYVSNGQDLNLSFSYPSDWTVNPPTNDNASDQTITATSPLMSIENVSSSTVTGKAIVSIRPATAQVSELASGNATAGQTSVQIGYTQPLASQQQYPYLSFVNLGGGTDASGGFQEVIITGQQQFSQGQSITSDDLSSIDPLISASFYSCSTQACTGSGEAPLSITMDTWQNTAPFIQVLALLQSLQLH